MDMGNIIGFAIIICIFCSLVFFLYNERKEDKKIKKEEEKKKVLDEAELKEWRKLPKFYIKEVTNLVTNDVIYHVSERNYDCAHKSDYVASTVDLSEAQAILKRLLKANGKYTYRTLDENGKPNN